MLICILILIAAGVCCSLGSKKVSDPKTYYSDLARKQAVQKGWTTK